MSESVLSGGWRKLSHITASPTHLIKSSASLLSIFIEVPLLFFFFAIPFPYLLYFSFPVLLCLFSFWSFSSPIPPVFLCCPSCHPLRVSHTLPRGDASRAAPWSRYKTGIRLRNDLRKSGPGSELRTQKFGASYWIYRKEVTVPLLFSHLPRD